MVQLIYFAKFYRSDDRANKPVGDLHLLSEVEIPNS